jgi:hypothetical protein
MVTARPADASASILANGMIFEFVIFTVVLRKSVGVT